MTQNLLSEKTAEQGKNAVSKQAPASASVAFRMPMEEKSAPLVNKEKRAPLQSPSKGVSASTSPSAPATVSKEKGGGFTQPEALTQGFGVDLLGGEGEHMEATLLSPQKTIALMAVAVVLVLLIIGAWRGILASREAATRRSLAETAAAIQSTRTFLDGVSEERKGIEARFQNIDIVRTLLAGHTYWTRFFSFLEAVTLPDVYYTNLSVDPSGHIRLAAVARDFSAVARQLMAFDDSGDVETIRMTKAAAEISGGQTGVQFDLEVAVKPALLFFQEQ